MRSLGSFVVASLLVVAVLIASTDAQAPATRTQWKMQSSWPAADFHQVNPKGLVEKIAEMTGGRLQIDLQAWAQRVVPYRRCCHPPYEFAADYYWKGANPYKIVKP
jgi:TRAP-type mannitol/chloroaromatic compound transport system substrate-binding protein